MRSPGSYRPCNSGPLRAQAEDEVKSVRALHGPTGCIWCSSPLLVFGVLLLGTFCCNRPLDGVIERKGRFCYANWN